MKPDSHREAAKQAVEDALPPISKPYAEMAEFVSRRHHRAAFMEELLSEGVVEAMTASIMYHGHGPASVNLALRAAFESIEEGRR